MIEFDVEARGLQWYHEEHSMFLAQFLGDGPTERPDLIGHGDYPHCAASPESIEHWLGHGDAYRAWNTKYDLHQLKAAGYALPAESTWHDGMVVAHLMDERTSVALQARGAKLFGDEVRSEEAAVQAFLTEERKRRKKVSKDEGVEYIEPNYSDIPWEIMEPYAAEDVLATQRIGQVYDPALAANEELSALYELEREVCGALFWMEERGIPVDRDALIALEADLLPKLDSYEEHCQKIAQFDNFNPRSPAQISEALDRLGADTRFMTRDSKTKQLKTDEENLEACDHPLAEAILTYRGTHKLWSMLRRMLHGKPGDKKFPLPYVTGDDLLHPNFRQVGARHGRMSCANPNFQQIHRDDLRLRYAIKAPPGKKLVCCDLDSIELRMLAAFAGEGAMLDAIREGRDPHVQTAKFVGLTGRRRSTGAVESPRDQGKRYNYLTIFGGGKRAIRKWFGIPQDEAGAVQERFLQAYPEIASLQARIEFALEDRGYVKSPWGRRHRAFNPRTASREAYKFVNYLISGTAADLFKTGTARCHREGLPLIAAVHDELIALVDEADAPEAAEIMQKAMTDHPRVDHKVPITAEAQIVDRWSDAKAKDGKLFVPDYIQEA